MNSLLQSPGMVAKVTLGMMVQYSNYGDCQKFAVGYYGYGVGCLHHGVVCYGAGCHGVAGADLHHGVGDYEHCSNHGAA